MKLFSFFKKNYLGLICIALTFSICAYVLCFGLKKARNYEVIHKLAKEQTIYSIWHVETFEGGGKARINYLKNIARTMEKQDTSSLFMIKSVDAENLENELKNSQPDIISFGFGVGKVVLSFLKEQNKTFDVRDELVSSGSFNKKFYAVPYMVSGYAMFNHSMQSTEFHVGANAFVKPDNIYSKLNLTPKGNETQYEAYKSFIYDKKVQLLGTGRDLFRISNLNSIGRTNAIITPIDTYTDLIQYLGIINPNKTTQEFLSLALNNINQNSLIDYSLFSSKYNKLYNTGIYSDMEDAIFMCLIPNVFVEPQHF